MESKSTRDILKSMIDTCNGLPLRYDCVKAIVASSQSYRDIRDSCINPNDEYTLTNLNGDTLKSFFGIQIIECLKMVGPVSYSFKSVEEAHKFAEAYEIAIEHMPHKAAEKVAFYICTQKSELEKPQFMKEQFMKKKISEGFVISIKKPSEPDVHGHVFSEEVLNKAFNSEKKIPVLIKDEKPNIGDTLGVAGIKWVPSSGCVVADVEIFDDKIREMIESSNQHYTMSSVAKIDDDGSVEDYTVTHLNVSDSNSDSRIKSIYDQIKEWKESGL